MFLMIRSTKTTVAIEYRQTPNSEAATLALSKAEMSNLLHLLTLAQKADKFEMKLEIQS